jgi:hypothetical protein
MPRRSPVHAERYTVAVRWVAAPAAHWLPLLRMLRERGYGLPRPEVGAAGVNITTADASDPESVLTKDAPLRPVSPSPSLREVAP